MRNFVLAVAAAATLGAFSVSAEAMPVSGAVNPVAKPAANVEKTVYVVTTRRFIRPRPRRTVCTIVRGPRAVTRRCVTR